MSKLPLEFDDLTDQERILEYISKLTYLYEVLQKYSEHQCVNFKIKNLHEINYESLSWIAANIRNDLNDNMQYFDRCDVEIRIKDCLISYKYANTYTVNGLKYVYNYNMTVWLEGKENAEEISENLYVIEDCENCVNWDKSGGIQHIPTDVYIKYVQAKQDIENKGGHGLWQQKSNKKMMKLNFTPELKQRYLRCKYAFDDGVPMIGHGGIFYEACDTIENPRKIPINILRMATNDRLHCKKYCPKPDTIDMNKLLCITHCYLENSLKITKINKSTCI